MRIINNDEILQHSGITETDLMNYYGLSKAQYDDYIAHFGIKGMLWGFANGIRQAGKRVAQGLDYDYQNNKYNMDVAKKATNLREIQKNNMAAKNQYAKRAADIIKARNVLRTNNIYTQDSQAQKAINNVTEGAVKYNKAKQELENAVNSRNNFQNSTYGKTLKTIKNVRTAVSSTASKALSTVKSTKAYQVGAKVANKVTSKISSLSSSALSKAKAKGQKLVGAITNTKLYNNAKNTASNIYNNTKNTASNIYNNAKNTASNIYNNAKNTASNIYQSIQNKFKKGKTYYKNGQQV